MTVVKFVAALAAGMFMFGANAGTQLYPASGTASYDGASDWNSESFTVPDMDAVHGGFVLHHYTANASDYARLEGLQCFNAGGAEVGGAWDLVYRNDSRTYDRVYFVPADATKANIRFQSSITASDITVEAATLAQALDYADTIWADVNKDNTLATVLVDYPLPADPFALLPRFKAALTSGETFRVHLLGDSITQDTFNSLFQALVRREFPNAKLRYTMYTESSTGCSVFQSKVATAVTAYSPDLLIICGLDNFRGTGYTGEAGGTAALASVIDQVREALPNCEILYVSPGHSVDCRGMNGTTVWQALPWGESRESYLYTAQGEFWANDCYKPAARAAALVRDGKAEVPCWDIFPQCYDFTTRSGRPYGYFNRDTVHNNERGKAVIARVMLEYFKAAASGSGEGEGEGEGEGDDEPGEDPVVPVPKTLADVGSTAVANDPNVELIDREDGTYALVFKSASMTKNWGEADYSTTFTFNSPWVVKEFLVVGGGGAGGGNVGAGGGGGGVIYFTEELLAANAATDNATTNFENGSTISITIGAGGVSGFKRKGTSGGHSTLKLGEKTYVAYGGGGGGDYGDNDKAYDISSTITDDGNPVTGADGNTGCGAGVYNGKKGTNGHKTSMPSQPGYYGTNGGENNGGSACGGGGGAGAAGSKSTVNNIGGKGGDGLPCSITGTQVYYAAGGGGGDNNQSINDPAKKAQGGLGGGGHGSLQIGRASPDTSTRPSEGTDATGFGCGGGGGVGGSSGTATGGNGSAGIVVLLIEPIVIEAEKPVVSVLVPEQGANYAKFSVSVVADGLDNTTTSEVWGGWAKEGDAIVCSKLGDGIAVNGSVSKTVTGLEVGTTYAYKFYAVNGEGTEGDPITGSITLSAGTVDPQSSDPVITCGACTVIGTSGNIPYCVAWPGADKETCAVTLKYGLMADKLSYSVALGSEVIGNGQAQATGLIPGRKYYFQLTADNGTARSSTEVLTATIADGETFPETFDARQPVIAGIGAYDDKFICGGDGVIYRGQFANYVENTEVTFHYKKEETWKESKAVVTPDGFTVTVTNDLEFSTDYPFYFTATAGDFADQTQEKSFNSKGAAIIADYLENGTQEQADRGTRIYYLQGNNQDIGCGTNTVLYLLARKSGTGDDWFILSSRKLTSPIGGSFYKISDEDSRKLEFGASYDLQFRIDNVSFGGYVFSSTNRPSLFKSTNRVYDDSIYTWCGTDGLWNDSSNWTTNKTRIGVAGYPVGYTATGIFTNQSAATVRIARAEQANKLEVTNAKGLCLFGESAEASVTVLNDLKVTNAELVFAGANPALKAEKGITFGDTAKSGSIPSSFTFNIPADGYAEAPLQLKSWKFADEINAGYKITVAVDPKSGFLQRTDDGSQLLISSASGIATNKIVLGALLDEECYKLRYAPAGAANPTELWLDVSVIDEPGTVRWTGAASDDWTDPENWKGGAAPIAGNVVRVAGTRTITLDGVTARITDAWISIGEDGSVTVTSGTVMPIPTLDVSRPVAGEALTVKTTTFAGIANDGFTVAWSRGATVAAKDYAPLSTELSITPTTEDCERFFKCTVADAKGAVLLEKEFFFSKLPVLYMTTDDGQTPTPQKEEHAGSVFVQGNAEWKSPYDGAMTIKVRGNSTSNFAKKPWKLKLDEKTKMFGIAKSKHWVLLANYKDKSSMRNKLAYDLANEIGSLGMESTWVECFLNGEYQGLYQFGEHIRIDKERVNIFDWEGAGEDAADAIAAANGFTKEDKKALETQMSTDFAWVTSGKVTYTNVEYEVADDFKNLDISGGYLVESSKEYDEVTKFTIKSGTLTFEAMLNAPEFLNTNEEMLNACSNRLTDYWAACASPDGYNAKGQHWSALANTDSMATYFLTLELFGNDDAEKKSRYLYWDVGGKIMFGPVWDFDWGVGNTVVDANINKPETWRVNNANERSFLREWTDDPWFCTRLRTLYWSKARAVFERMISEGGELDQYHAYLAEAAAANDVKWPVKDLATSKDLSFEDDVAKLRTFLTTRLAWLDKQFADVPTLMASLKAACSTRQSNSPYTADAAVLPITFGNAPKGSIAKGPALQVTLDVANDSVKTVDVYANGLKVGESVPVADGKVSVEVPSRMLSEKIGNDNCISLVARDADGAVVARNYALIKLAKGIAIILR